MKNENKHEEVMRFINRFTCNGKFKEVEVTFTQGCCYWFAYILHKRFFYSKLMYDEIENHFVTEVNGRAYDITGEVTGKYNLIQWPNDVDPLLEKRIRRDCINF